MSNRRLWVWGLLLGALAALAGGYAVRRRAPRPASGGGSSATLLDRPVEADSGAHKGPGIELVPEPEYLKPAPSQK